MSVYINNITFKNYRQYKDVNINLKTTGLKLNALVAVNGTGKTMFLNGINWCLYSKEPNLSDKEKAQPIVNESVIDSLNEGDNVETSVIINLIENENNIQIIRSEVFDILNQNGIKNVISRGKNNSNLIVIVNYKESNRNADVFENSDAEMFVKQYFDEAIKEYYFFDGEKLEEYFSNDRSKMIKDSIYNISQVTLLKNTIAHLKSLENEKARNFANKDPELFKKQQELDKQNDLETLYLNKIIELENKNEEINKELTNIDEQLRGYGPIRNKINERKEYNAKCNEISEKIKNIKNEKISLIRDNTYNLLMYKRINKIYEYILSKENDGQFPPEVDRSRIENTLQRHECDFCHSHLTPEGEKYLLDLLSKLAVSNKTSTYLVSLKSTYELILSKAQSYKRSIHNLEKSENSLKKDYNAYDTELKKISAFLSNYNSESETDIFNIDVKKLEKKRTVLNSELKLNNTDLGTTKERLVNTRAKIDELSEQIDSLKEDIKIIDKAKKEVRVLRTSSKYLEQVMNNITSKIKNNIKEKTWELFNTVIWKNNSFKSIDIDDNYSLSVIGKYDREVSGSLSATEKMALAYAFTFAIHDASGKNCPVVIDSPLGRTSDINKVNLVKRFIEISNDKQIVLLLTEDECSSNIQQVLNEKNISIKKLKLNNDETEIGNGGLI